jgi:hypothetical protein
MTDDTPDVCGAPTAAGGTCDHQTTDDGDPDRCWIDGHNDADVPDDQQPGHPSKLADHKDAVLEAARKGVTLEGCARAAGIDESTLYRWRDKYDEFAEELRQARHEAELDYVDDVSDRGAQFMLERSFGYVKREEIAHEGDAMGDVRVTFTPDDEDGDE